MPACHASSHCSAIYAVLQTVFSTADAHEDDSTHHRQCSERVKNRHFCAITPNATHLRSATQGREVKIEAYSSEKRTQGVRSHSLLVAIVVETAGTDRAGDIAPAGSLRPPEGDRHAGTRQRPEPGGHASGCVVPGSVSEATAPREQRRHLRCCCSGPRARWAVGVRLRVRLCDVDVRPGVRAHRRRAGRRHRTAAVRCCCRCRGWCPASGCRT